jgi:hypothetical protein
MSQDLVIPKRAVGGRGTCCLHAAPQLMWRQPPRLSKERSDAASVAQAAARHPGKAKLCHPDRSGAKASEVEGPAFWWPSLLISPHYNTAGAPFLRVLCEGAGTTNVPSCEATPPDPGTRSSSSLRSRAPARLRPKDRNDNCSSATPPVRPPSPFSRDCDAYTAASPRASSSPIR